MTDPVQVQARLASRDNSHQFVRVLRWYEKSGDQLVGEVLLDSLRLPELQTLFQESADNPMVDCYSVSTTQVAQLQTAIAQQIDLSAYDYYLECDAV